MGFPGGSVGKESPCNAEDAIAIPGSGRFPGVGNGDPLQYSYLENSMDRGAWWAIVHRVTKSWTCMRMLVQQGTLGQGELTYLFYKKHLKIREGW